mmetsp:Transcript_3583/g.4642  ORF Transcript_3583/g.4642 Transcript_3583/m.4642 type:complete len:80 (-) Transcript_3583:16-255(-)
MNWYLKAQNLVLHRKLFTKQRKKRILLVVRLLENDKTIPFFIEFTFEWGLSMKDHLIHRQRQLNSEPRTLFSLHFFRVL